MQQRWFIVIAENGELKDQYHAWGSTDQIQKRLHDLAVEDCGAKNVRPVKRKGDMKRTLSVTATRSADSKVDVILMNYTAVPA